MLPAKVRDRPEVRTQPVQQEPQLDVPPALPHQPSGGTDPVEIAVDVQLHQQVRAVRRPPCGRGHGVLKSHRLEIEAVHEHLDEPRRAVLRDRVFNASDAHGHLAAVHPGDVAHANSSSFVR